MCRGNKKYLQIFLLKPTISNSLRFKCDLDEIRGKNGRSEEKIEVWKWSNNRDKGCVEIEVLE